MVAGGMGFSIIALVVILVQGLNLRRMPRIIAHAMPDEYPMADE
jgi:hypothetical protein